MLSILEIQIKITPINESFIRLQLAYFEREENISNVGIMEKISLSIVNYLRLL